MGAISDAPVPGHRRTGDLLRTVAAVCMMLVAGGTVFDHATDGFQAFTLESARRFAALKDPQPVPRATLEFDDGRRGTLRTLKAPVILVDFLYTRCETFCVALGAVYARLQRELAPEIARGEVELLSISFDPQRDGPQALTDYRERHTADPHGWTLARPISPADLPQWLNAFGVVVIPDGQGGFVHNAAVHIVGPDRRLVAILDMNDVNGVVNWIRGTASIGAFGDVSH